MTTPPGSTRPADPAPDSANGAAHTDRPAYRLAHEPEARSWTARENLVDILERELLGPANGLSEILDTTPDQAYLIGRIAPVRIIDRGVPEDRDTGEPDTDVGDDLDAALVSGVPVTGVDDTSVGDDEGDPVSTEDAPQKRGLVIPASMGLRFQIPMELESFTVTASWGMYKRVKNESEEPGVARLPRFQRTPFEFPVPVTVSDLTPGETRTEHLRDTVQLRIDRYDDEQNGRRLIEVALCNNRETGRHIPTEAWMYQTHLSVEAGGSAVFLPASDPLTDDRPEPDEDLRRLNLQYRKHLEYAVGRTCSVDWDVTGYTKEEWDTATQAPRARRVWTTWLPTSETPQTATGEVPALLDMLRLAEADPAELRTGLAPIVLEYAVWLDTQQARANRLPEHLRIEAHQAIAEARSVQQQLAEGLEHLLADDEALRCFRFMNRVMAAQRIQSQVAGRRAQHPAESIDGAREKILEDKGALAHSWRTFQLAFIIMQLPMLTDPTATKRSGIPANTGVATAQLLFFPTGGGKTEAYLGLAAYAFAIRRRQGVVESDHGPLDGGSGVAVLMRYTLRLLTAQQFQRATALVCAAEVERQKDETTWGSEPFRIGLWVGSAVSPKWFADARDQLAKANDSGREDYRLPVLQIKRCPWCGNRIGPADVTPDEVDLRIRVYCSDDLAECPFSPGGSVADGLPVLTVDEEIYRLAPAFVIATVDKFARLAREGEAAALFGYVSQRCDRHGYIHPDYKGCALKDGTKHQAKNGHSAATRRPAGRLRPPDLIIQDELHLITGALGTTVGLFESAIDVICQWHTADGHPVRPLLVASTATAFKAADQVRKLYARDVTIFPPQVLDAGDTFFSEEQPVSQDHPGRRYVGISTTGVRVTTAEIRVAEILMAAGQLLIDTHGLAADPYLTLVGYFSATRELAGMARYLGDDVETLLRKGRPWSRLPRRYGTRGVLNTAELTSRVSGTEITDTLDQMAVPFDPARDASGAKRGKREAYPLDAVLATSMLQVGVDVTRLGLMLVVGQPKNTAEYIQASSRVGRDPNRPGLVVTLGNWARPRDLAHFEQFRHYHETFYAKVEALSVTPYSVTSMERGLDGVLVSAARVIDADRISSLSPEQGAARVDDEHEFLERLINQLAERVLRASGEDAADRARTRLHGRLAQWVNRRAALTAASKALVYEKKTSEHVDTLMISAENARALRTSRTRPPFVVANSMREVQPEINLLVSPTQENLVYTAPADAPAWDMPEAYDGKEAE
ncbi:DISARM system helicase DrmA [Nocardia wallacei]|uniref:DISARM system helicase DrmA n=1 Tax=Nocardia wallacei TaxID=480035 RepID=UPI002458E84A|nr:DISARM system helicase DrmA [Nocardia wallacei]